MGQIKEQRPMLFIGGPLDLQMIIPSSDIYFIMNKFEKECYYMHRISGWNVHKKKIYIPIMLYESIHNRKTDKEMNDLIQKKLKQFCCEKMYDAIKSALESKSIEGLQELYDSTSKGRCLMTEEELNIRPTIDELYMTGQMK